MRGAPPPRCHRNLAAKRGQNPQVGRLPYGTASLRNGLVSQNILARDRRHVFNSLELFNTCQRLTNGRLSHLPLAGDSVTDVNLSGSQSRTPLASDL